MLLRTWNMKRPRPTMLKFLADLNISPKTVAYLDSLGIDIIRVDKANAEDGEVVKKAKREGRVILTFDKDFGEIYYYFEKGQISVIVLSFKDQRHENVNKVLTKFLAEVKKTDMENRLMIVYEDRYRMIK